MRFVNFMMGDLFLWYMSEANTFPFLPVVNSSAQETSESCLSEASRFSLGTMWIPLSSVEEQGEVQQSQLQGWGVGAPASPHRRAPEFPRGGRGVAALGYLFSLSLWCVWPRTEIYGGGRPPLQFQRSSLTLERFVCSLPG